MIFYQNNIVPSCEERVKSLKLSEAAPIKAKWHYPINKNFQLSNFKQITLELIKVFLQKTFLIKTFKLFNCNVHKSRFQFKICIT